MSQDYKEINIRLKEIDNLGLFMLATKRILDSNCRELIEACTETMHGRVVECQEEAIEIAKDIEVVDELSTMVVDIMVHDLTRRLEEALSPKEEKKPSLTLLEGGLKDEKENVNKKE